MIRQKSEKKCILKDFGTFRAYFWYNIHAMKSEKFDFGAMLDEQLKGIKRSYKFGNSFNESKSLTGPKKAALAVESGDNAEIKAAYESGDAIAGLVEKEIKVIEDLKDQKALRASKGRRVTRVTRGTKVQ